MTTGPLETVSVYADLEHFEALAQMGSLRRQRSRSGDIFSFEYEPTWLQKPEAFSFDPDLALVNGPRYPVPGRPNFGIFLDSSPDRWGRVLMQRRENIRARHEGRRVRSLTEWDFLLGVHDETQVFSSNHTSTTKSTPTMNGGSRNCLLQARPSVGHVRKHL